MPNQLSLPTIESLGERAENPRALRNLPPLKEMLALVEDPQSILIIPVHPKLWAIIDKEDAPLIKPWSWYANEHGYALRRRYENDRKLVKMHREILGLGPKEFSDHINGFTLDNRRCNLRRATRYQNMWNSRKKQLSDRKPTSKYKGVCYDKRRGRWYAEIWQFHKKIFIGSYKTELDAAKAYNQMAANLFGEFANLNAIP